MAPTLILFLIIFLEGYVVLSTELLAIRLLIPFVGSGTDTISIVIAAVLMPLAFGYFAGGQFKTRKNGALKSTVRKKLIYNLLISAVILSVGLSYFALNWGVDTFLHYSSLKNRFTLTVIYALLFLVYPVFLLGQTVPLISNYFSRDRLPVMAGKILFFSTLGSFMGAVFCTLVLMTWLGVHYTAVVTIASLTLLIILLSKKLISRESLAAVACLIFAFALNNSWALQEKNIVANNKYHTIQVNDFGRMVEMRINHNMSAGWDKETGSSFFEYIKYIERTFIDPLIWRPGPPRDILVIGAGGFTLGATDDRNNYIFLDLDKNMKDIAEQHFLKQKLGPNKHFEPVEARAYLARTEKKFDLIVLDVFRGPSKSPEHLVTQEFFQQVKNALKPGGVMAANYLAAANFMDDFSVNLDNTIRSVFPNVNRYTMGAYSAWDPEVFWSNVIYSYFDNPRAPDTIYTDNKNTSLFDKPLKLH